LVLAAQRVVDGGRDEGAAIENTGEMLREKVAKHSAER
jgi:hypothetical protein